MFPIIGPVATTNDVTYVTPSYVVDHSPKVGQAGHFRSWPRVWINRIGPVATTNDVTYVTPSYVVDHSPSVGQARHFQSWPRGWINRIDPVAIFNVSGPSYEIVYMPELGHLLCVCRVGGLTNIGLKTIGGKQHEIIRSLSHLFSKHCKFCTVIVPY